MTFLRGSLRVLSPQMAIAFVVVKEIFSEEGLSCVLTSGWRAKGAGSIHPYGLALDFDAPRPVDDAMWKRIEREARERLGSEFDVLAHDAGSGMHLHVEYDPRGVENTPVET